MEENTKYVSIRLKSERTRLGYKLDNAEVLCGVTSRTFSRWEKDTPIPSDKLAILFEHDFDVYYILTGGRISPTSTGSAEISNTDNTSLDSKASHNMDTDNYSFTESETLATEVGTIGEQEAKQYGPLSIEEIADLGKRFFDAWSNVFHTHGTEMQSAIMSALKGSEIAHIMVSEQFKQDVKPCQNSTTDKAHNESKKK